MARYRASMHSPTDPRSVFAYLSRFDRAVEWDPGVTAGQMLTDEPVGIGSKFRLDARFLGRTLPLVYEIVTFDPPNRIVLRAQTAAIRSTDTISFAEAPGETAPGTVVVYEALLEGKGPLRFAEPAISLLFRRIGDRAAAGLRARLLELPTV